MLQRGQTLPSLRPSEASGGSEEFWRWTGSPPCNPSVWPPPPPLGTPVAPAALNNATAPRVVFASRLWPPGVFTVTVNTAGKSQVIHCNTKPPGFGMWSPHSYRLQPQWSPAAPQLCGRVVWKHLKCFTAFGRVVEMCRMNSCEVIFFKMAKLCLDFWKSTAHFRLQEEAFLWSKISTRYICALQVAVG